MKYHVIHEWITSYLYRNSSITASFCHTFHAAYTFSAIGSFVKPDLHWADFMAGAALCTVLIIEFKFD